MTMQGNRLVARRYRLISLLGSGGFGRVWRARDERLGATVAVKEVWLPAGPPAVRADYLERAEREARNTAKLRSASHVVPVYDVINEAGALWMVMRLIEGQSLEQRLAVGVLSAAEAGHVATNLLQALHAAHAAGVVHRDLKPGNVLLERGGEVWLTDFGIAVHHDDPTLTAPGTVIGTPEYVAPERANGGDAGPPSDLFSLGVVLFRALEGSTPFQRDTVSATLRAVMMHEPGPARNAGELAELITALLRKDPDRRPTAAAALAMLTARREVVAAGASASAPRGARPLPAGDLASHAKPGRHAAAPRDPPQPRPARRKPLFKVAVIGVAACALAGLIATLVVNRLDSGPPNLALHKRVYASSNPSNTNGWSKDEVTNGITSAFPGSDQDMGWASDGHSNSNAPEWIEVDLGTEEPIDDVVLYPRNDPQAPGGGFPSDFTISLSTDGKTWSPPVVAYNGYHSPGTTPQSFFFPRKTARYVKVEAWELNKDVDSSSHGYFFELKQIEIFNR